MKYLVLAAAATAFAAPAFAQQTPADAEFTGPRIEAHVGYDRLGVDNDDFDDGIDGVMYGVGVGFDFAVSGAVVGVEVNADFSDIDEGVTDGADSASFEAKRDLDASVRVGAVLGGKALLYGKVGYANSRFEARATSGGITISEADNLDGVRAGVGIEYVLGSKAYIKAEYRYTNYEQDLDRNQVIGGIGIRF